MDTAPKTVKIGKTTFTILFSDMLRPLELRVGADRDHPEQVDRPPRKELIHPIKESEAGKP